MGASGAKGTVTASGSIATSSNGTIATTLNVTRISPSGAITGVILQAGTVAGQMIYVINESAYTITFAASGTSHVADGTSDVIASLTARVFVWNTGTSLWYRLA